ncbi:c(7)-type cytochrome triheme domain-containing protein [Thalassotalea aquiviva]|uniref:c(7)-type cytochrome triheme domain-containing protein n=1 Tax=Thalassotalea aquiviva TaxID=3242415 RepID=UPI00352AE76A
MKYVNILAGLFLAGTALSAFSADIANGNKISDAFCASCHKPGVMGAPKLGSKDDWQPRADKGLDSLHNNAINGVRSMPAKGGNFSLSAQDIKDVVAYMLKEAGVVIASNKVVAKATTSKAITTAPKPTPTASTKVAKRKNAKVMNFNRLMKPPSEWNPAPFEDGIHDPDGEGAYMLQEPKELFDNIEKSRSGNRVDWVKSLDKGLIIPRWDKEDANKQPFVMDLNIVREVKGSMPNVVYPHKQHTEWLDCSNCHPDIFIPKKGANQISMASILMGEKCGVCHGKVAFPVSDCRKCHSQNKKKPLVASNKK